MHKDSTGEDRQVKKSVDTSQDSAVFFLKHVFI